MQREYLILVGGEKNCGAVKVQPGETGLLIEVDVDHGLPLTENGVFKAYAVCPSAGETDYLGVLDGYRGRFKYSGRGTFGIVVTRKNTADRKEEFLCCCGEEGKIAEVRQCFLNFFDKKEKPQGEKKEAAVLPSANYKETEQAKGSGGAPDEKPFVKEYLKTALQKLEKLTEGYDSEKINGYFIRRNSRLMESVMGADTVYRRIMSHGYYIFSARQNEKGESFIISVPSSRQEENPFTGYEKYAFRLKSDMADDTDFFCIAAGNDENGEFFLKKV